VGEREWPRGDRGPLGAAAFCKKGPLKRGPPRGRGAKQEGEKFTSKKGGGGAREEEGPPPH